MMNNLDLCSGFQSRKSLRRSSRNVDRISSLPEGVLLLILSFISFKEVAKMSILSRRWMNLWVQYPVLDFQAPAPEGFVISKRGRRKYIEWVNSVLLRHKCPCLKEFRIVYDLDKCNQKDIERWLVFAFSRKVEHLQLHLMFSGCYWPGLENNSVFSSWFLDFNSRKSISYGDFTCLKSLSLKRVDVTGEAINFFLMKCPRLEQVEVFGSMKLVNLVLSYPYLALKYLRIEWCCNLKVLSISNFKLVALEIPPVDDLTLTNLPMLVELSIQGTSVKLSRSLTQASSCFSQLELFMLKFTGIGLQEGFRLSDIHQFTKLKRLAVCGRVFSDQRLPMFTSIINSFPRLEVFVMQVVKLKVRIKHDRTLSSRDMNEVERRGACLKSKSLKIFEFFGFYGRDRDVELIMHMVDKAVGLEKIIIDLTSFSTTITQEVAARNTALRKLDSLRKCIPPHVHLLIR